MNPLIRIPQIPDEELSKPGPKPKPRIHQWDRERLLLAHRRYVAGFRDDWTCEGERVYNTARKRTQTRGLSAEDRLWCEQQVKVWARAAWERENRRDTPRNDVLKGLAPHLLS